MTSKYLVTLLGYAVLLVLRSVVGEECSQDISNENCSLTTHNNEIEALSPQHTQEITTHAPELITTMTSLNAATENSVENTFRPMITESVSSSTPSATNSTESSTSNIMEDSTLNSSETSTVNTMKSVTTTINLPATLTSNMIEHSTTNSSEASTAVSLETTTTTTSNALEISALNITEAPMLNMSETSTLNTMELDESSNLTVANLSDISTLHIAEVLISNSSDMTVSNPSNSSVSNSSETLTSFSTDTSTSNETDMSTLSAISHSNSSEISTSNSSESFTFLNVMEGEELPDTSTPNLIDTSILNSSETSTSNLMEDSTSNLMQATTLDSMETTETSATNSVKKSMPYVLESSSSSMETSTSNLSEISTPTVMETTTLKQMESSTSHIPMDMVHSSDASTSNFIDTVTETSVDSSADTSNHHSTETSTDLLTTENLTEVSTDNPTENAMNEEATTAATTNAADEPKGRSLNFSVEEENPNNVLSNISHHHDDNFELNDAQVHDDDDFNVDVDSLDSKILAPKNQIHNSSQIVCEKGGLTYENGEKLELGCESVCTCRDGKMDCTDRCVGPYFRRGKKIDDPYCTAKEVEDPCCSVLVCAGDTETEPLEICSYENKTYNRGDTFNKSCTEICTCEIAGKISCKPRCPPITKTSDRCVEVPDPNDFCCLKVLCDVTLDEHDTEKDEEKSKPKLLGAKYVNMSAILLTFESHARYDDNENLPIIEVSNDKSNWDYYKLLPGGIVFVKDKFRYLKIENTNDVVEVEDTELASPDQLHIPSEADLALQLDTEHNLHPSTEHLDNAATCSYKGKTFEDGEEYNDECRFLCKCQNEEMKCLKMECPTYFGVDVLDPNCIEWETIPPDFVPSPPKCCPDKVHCKNNGSCEYEGRTYKNWDLIPSNITGCEKKCYCEMNNVECENICPPVTALPPPTLDCPPHLAMVSHIPDDDCCKYWVCNKDDHTSELLHDHTDSDIKGQIPTNSTDNYVGPFASNVPSKMLGPLAVYANEDSEQTIVNNSLGILQKPKLDPHENPYYHKKSFPANPHKPTISKNSQKDKSADNLNQPNPSKINNKPSKNSQNKLANKDNSLFVTAPPISEENNYQKHEKYIPNYYTPPPPHFTFDPSSHINIHSHSSPEEILQFIHQHPELGNYPSGSVLEIHNVAPNDNMKHLPGNEPSASIAAPKIHLVPYIVPVNSDGQPEKNDLPPGFSLEEILQVFQQNSQGLQNNPLDFLNPPQNSANNGHVLPPQQNGPFIHSKHNTTQSGNDGQILPESYPDMTHQHPQEDIVIQSLQPVDPHKVRLSFTVPSIIVGLHGRFEVRYTHNKDEKDLDSWMLTVFAPPNDLIATPSLEFDLTDLKADTEYSIKITVTLRDLHNMPSSKIYKVKTPKEVEPPVIPIDPDLAITDINATWVTVIWKAFTQYQLQFIDGIQLRYKEIDGRIYTATPLIHRAVTRYTLEKLKPNTKYEIGIYFIPFPGQMTELHAKNILHFTTANEIDTYGFNVTLEISNVKSQSVEISWNGVPYPEDKYVNIYRAIYQSDSSKEDYSTFKMAKRDSPTRTIIKDLKPGTRYRLWLEVYLTNGKIKTSNVEDFITKTRPLLAPALGASTQQDKLSRAEVLETKGDYYGPLVIVAILAAIAILSTLILLLILVRRHNQNKAAITPPSTRISQSAYDNPTYKVEIQQETMGL